MQAHEGKLLSIRIGDVDISVQILDNEYRVAVLERLIDLLLRRSPIRVAACVHRDAAAEIRVAAAQTGGINERRPGEVQFDRVT